MSEIILKEIYFYSYAVLTGYGMAQVYDCLRLLRRCKKHARWQVDLEDIIYLLFCFCLSFYLLYYGNNGVVRYVAILGAFIGMKLYFWTVGRVFVEWIYQVLCKVVRPFYALKKRLTCTINRHTMKMSKWVRERKGDIINGERQATEQACVSKE